jgi:hypothetical protein
MHLNCFFSDGLYRTQEAGQRPPAHLDRCAQPCSGRLNLFLHTQQSNFRGSIRTAAFFVRTRCAGPTSVGQGSRLAEDHSQGWRRIVVGLYAAPKNRWPRPSVMLKRHPLKATIPSIIRCYQEMAHRGQRLGSQAAYVIKS